MPRVLTPRLLNLKVELTSTTSLQSMFTSALLDSGTTGLFIDKKFCAKHKIETTLLKDPVPVVTTGSPHSRNGSPTTGLGLSLEAGPSVTSV